MEENEEKRIELIQRFYQIYRSLQKEYDLRCHAHFDVYGNNSIKIWKRESARKKICICKVKEKSETECYKRAAELLEIYRKDKIAKDEKMAG